MKKFVLNSWQIFIAIFGFSLISTYKSVSVAQLTSDGTVNTQINQNGNTAEITGGETRGSNLFHSFQDFSVQTGNEAFFNNANNISNIFSRVTGGNISNIDGGIRANGSSSLFLINPAGIIFGESARLDIGGSFYGSTASSILFEDGEFSAVDNLNQPVLTVNAPIGLGFRDNPEDIVNRSTVQDSAAEVSDSEVNPGNNPFVAGNLNFEVGLEVNPGNNITFVAGNLNFEGGSLTASGGDIYLGAISESGTVEISEDGSLSFAEDISRGDITLSDASEIDVRGSGGGNIKVDVQNLNLEGGELGASFLIAGISEESTAIGVQAGDISIDATGNISINREGEIINAQEGFGNSGNVFITADSLSLLNGSLILTNTISQGNAGAVNVTATGDISIDGEDAEGFASEIGNRILPNAVGDSGGVTISTNNLNLTAGGSIASGIGGQGNPAAVNITATGDISIDGELSRGIPSGIISRIGPSGEGNAGGVTVSTNNLNLTNGGEISASTAGQGNAGEVNVTATEDINADGEGSLGIPSGITSRVDPDVVRDPDGIIVAVGNAGGVTVSTNNLNLTAGGRVSASTLGQGNANNVNIEATESITINGFIEDFRSGISANALN